MILKTRCKCGQINQSETSVGWVTNGSVPVVCSGCSNVYMATEIVEEEQKEESKEVQTLEDSGD